MSNETQHTPGPWKAGNNIRSGAFVITLDGAVEIESGEQMGDVIAHHIGAPLGNGYPDANARLIAAAPELLDALEDLYGEVMAYQPELMDSEDWGPVLRAAQTAIAKAKGA